MKLLEGKIALITGGARGIGKAIAIEFAKQGCNVAFTDLEIDDNAKAVEKELQSYGVNAKAYASNAASFESSQQTVTEILQDFTTIDILVNNAGITRDNLIMRMTPKDFNDVIEANLNSVFYCMKLASRIMMKQRYGKIISISSIVGLHGNAGQVNYSASKAGILGMTKSLAKELASRNVTVNAIAPGFIQTSMTDKLPENIINSMLENIPLAKLGRPEDIADTVVFLASDRANYITGQTISVDGGMSI